MEREKKDKLDLERTRYILQFLVHSNQGIFSAVQFILYGSEEREKGQSVQREEEQHNPEVEDITDTETVNMHKTRGKERKLHHFYVQSVPYSLYCLLGTQTEEVNCYY